ncbi:formylmethanofuran dehydrogenase subunit C [Roseimaritima sediminicola]|uniref:formylmethanofuran dehydrogenase subunit C n=1 Tax=Roseimaritima sediminicola TaxID=2662066 RepID=UPI0012982657|nr:formylmethanofuran dehydrogenase subunit C [Roseimaritima sediminicola]
MNSVTLTLRSTPPCTLWGESLSPENLAGLSERQIAAMSLPGSRQALCVGDLFSVRVDSTDNDSATVTLVGDCGRFTSLGRGMQGGTLVIEGAAGTEVGRQMRGGVLCVRGDCGHFAGVDLRGGRLIVEGNAGDYVGGPSPGQRSGMSGGTILIRGGAGSHAAYRLRRGTIAITGSAGPFAAAEMVAGTLVVASAADAGLAVGMRRGTVILGTAPNLPLEGFSEPRRETPSVMPLLRDSLRRLLADAAFPTLEPTRDVYRCLGDRVVDGMGELLW